MEWVKLVEINKIMGWDAYAKFNKTSVDGIKILAYFKAASIVVGRIYSNEVDGYLASGGLDCGICGEYLKIATNGDIYKDWNRSTVELMYEQANWEKAKTVAKQDNEMWAYYSAKMFLKICYRYKLRIRFSY